MTIMLPPALQFPPTVSLSEARYAILKGAKVVYASVPEILTTKYTRQNYARLLRHSLQTYGFPVSVTWAWYCEFEDGSGETVWRVELRDV
jgi:hypothetical protein